MRPADMEEALRAVVVKNSRVPVSSFGPEAELGADLGFDSLAFLLTLGDLEQKFGVVIPVEEIDELRDITFGRLLELVLEALSRGGSTP